MNKKIVIISIIIILIFSVFAYSQFKKLPTEVYSDNGINYSSKINENTFQVLKDGNWESIIIKGVSLSNEIPGESEISRKQYYSWFKSIGEMNANTIRAYTILSPDFYKALKQYNEKNQEKIYLFQGVLIEEDILNQSLDAFKLDNILPFKEDIKRTINVVHGNITLPERVGYPHGKYTADVSPYVMGWILGVEWYPYLVDNMNNNRLDKSEFNGEFVYTEDAKPFEYWLADIMDYTLSYEMKEYNWQRPISFVNSPSTDILDQKYEPLEQENIASINPNSIKFKNNLCGYFASYNIYPYYPNFLNLDPKYTKHIDHRGKANNFAGYLRDLISSHNIPVLVSEFGIPSSRAMSYVNVHGWNKGFISEEEQGNILSNLFEDIIHEGYMGGIINAWEDTWLNELWSNTQNPQEQLGLLSFDRNKITIDGSKKDWRKNKVNPIYSPNKKDVTNIKNIYMDNDEKYLYFAVEYKDLDLSDADTLIFIDTLPDQGNSNNPYNSNISTESGMEFIIRINDKGNSKIIVDSYYDSHYFQYGKLLDIIPENPLFESKGNELYKPIKLALNKETIISEIKQKMPFNDYETGILKQGNSNSDSLADYYINKKDNLMELRIPWGLLGFANPSEKEVIGDLYIDGLESKQNIDSIAVAVVVYDSKNPEDFDSFPRANNGKILVDEIYKYSWDNWDKPIIEERFKKSYYIMKDKFGEY